MNLRDEIRQKIADSSYSNIAIEMGYSNMGIPKACKRIRYVIQGENLGLDTCAYDWKFSNSEFVIRLCEVLGIDAKKCKKEVARISTELSTEKARYKSWIFVNTNFIRKSEPIFALAALESSRRIQIPKEIGVLPFEHQIPHVKAIIRRHYSESGGEIDMWGTIGRYEFFFAEHQAILFHFDGSVVIQGHQFEAPYAKILLKGKELFNAM